MFFNHHAFFTPCNKSNTFVVAYQFKSKNPIFQCKAFSNLYQIFLPCTYLITFITSVHNCKLNLPQKF